jgi:hypothetical protein
VFIVLEHRRREVLHFNVTEHPTAVGTSQQIIEIPQLGGLHHRYERISA